MLPTRSPFLAKWPPGAKHGQLPLGARPCFGSGRKAGHGSLGALQAEILTEVEPTHLLVGDDLVRPSFREHPARMNHVSTVREAQRLAHVMISDEHADAASGQVT